MDSTPSLERSMPLPGRGSSAWLAGALTVVGCCVFAGAARWLNDNIGYANAFGCDCWYFFGIHLNFHEIYNSKRFYQAFRFPALVPWIFLGGRIPYEALNALRFFTYFVMTCAGCLWYSTRLFGAKVAAVITVLFCCSTGFLGVLSTDYVTAAGVAWASLLVGTTVQAGCSRRPLTWGVLSGIFFGMCFYTHIPIVLFIFAVPLLFFAAPEQTARFKRFAFYAVGGMAGFGFMTAVCGLYNWSLGGSWLFLGPEIRYALSLTKDASLNAPYLSAGLAWMTTEATVVSMELGVLASLAVLLVNLGRPHARTSNVVAAVYLSTAAMTMGWQLSGRVLIAYQNVFAPWIYPTLLAAFGAALSRLKAVHDMSWPALAGTLVLAACALLFAARSDVSTVPGGRLLASKVAFGLVFALSLVTVHRSRAGIAAVPALALFMAVNYPNGYGSFPWAAPAGQRGRDMAVQAARALRKLDELHLAEIPAFWVNLSQPETVAIPRSFLYCYNFGGSFPSLSPGDGFEAAYSPLTKNMIGSTRTLVVIAPGTNLAALAAPRLRTIGLDSTSLGEWPIGSGGLRNTMAVLRLAPARADRGSAPATASFVGTDTATQGNWVGRYGRSGYTVAGDATSYPGYAQVTEGGTAFSWQAVTADKRALQHAMGAGRVAAGWYSFSSITIDLDLTDGAPHQVALYGVDWDAMSRDEHVDIVDAITGTVLDTRQLSGFMGGQYLVWTVRGHVSLVVTRTGGINAVVSGLFLDPVPGGGEPAKGPPAPAH
jgi:hypothetical protein